MNKEIKEKISLEVIKVLKSRFNSFPETVTLTRNAPFHKAFLSAFSDKFIKINTNAENALNISSWLHGLNTTLGQSFFESVARILSNGHKQSFKNNQIPLSQNILINEIMTDLKNGSISPNKSKEENNIFNTTDTQLVSVPNFTADCFFEDQDKVVAIELKSVRPNSGEMRGEKQKILQAKAALKIKFPKKQIFYYFGFPFDPLAKTETGYNKKKFMDSIVEFAKFCDPKEILLSEELWSFLSKETKTMEKILTIIKKISVPSFKDDLLFLSSPNYFADKEKYNNTIKKWNLFCEQKISENINHLINCKNTSISRNATIPPFSEDGEYDFNRAHKLLDYIKGNNL